MLDAERGAFGEPRHPLDSTQIFAGPNDGLSQTCNGVSTFVGLQGHSQKTGYRVIFPTLDMGRYLEIAEEDILATEELSPAQSPFGALGGTRLSVRESARIMTSRAASGTQEVDDEFDLDIRLGASGWSMPGGAPDEGFYAPGYEGEEKQGAIKTNGACPTDTCKTCVTCGATCATCAGENTCHTCQTRCNQHTCQTCQTCPGENTCQTCKGEATCQTCQTCNTQCQQNTCQTCKGEVTCQTCQTHCQQNTCGVTCHTCPDNGCVPKTETCCKKGTCM
jgi:hypothetical protein